jgi:hypothetical protein
MERVSGIERKYFNGTCVWCRMRILQWNVCLVSNEDTSMERVLVSNQNNSMERVSGIE